MFLQGHTHARQGNIITSFDGQHYVELNLNIRSIIRWLVRLNHRRIKHTSGRYRNASIIRMSRFEKYIYQRIDEVFLR